jgi:hypothetical protein
VHVLTGLRPVVVVLVLTLGAASSGSAECGNALWWQADDSDPEIQQHLRRSRMMGHECVEAENQPPGCEFLVQLGERYLDYLILQYEHSRASDSRTHQGQSPFWLSIALRYGDLLRSPTAIRYVRDHVDAIATPPPRIDPQRWALLLQRVFESAGMAPG